MKNTRGNRNELIKFFRNQIRSCFLLIRASYGQDPYKITNKEPNWYKCYYEKREQYFVWGRHF